MGRLEGKVAFITGVARGQGRNHALRFAQEGADIIGIDICEDIATIPYPLANESDLAETAEQIEKLGRKAYLAKADVRDLSAIETVVQAGVASMGRLDIIVANAGIGVGGDTATFDARAWHDVIDVSLNGVWHTLRAGLAPMRSAGRGGSVVVTSSVCGVRSARGLGAYNVAKHGLTGLIQTLAMELGPEYIRVNSVLPANCDTPMIQNDYFRSMLVPGVENPSRDDIGGADGPLAPQHPIPVPWVDVDDVSEAVLFLVSEAARYVTGIALPVDAGALIMR